MILSENVKFAQEEKNISVDPYNTGCYGKELERYRFVYEQIGEFLKSKPEAEFLDIGCANADFIYYLKKKLPKILYCGVEYNQKLIEIARNETFLNEVEIIQGDAREFDFQRSFDVVHMSGVLSIFDNYESALSNMIRHLKADGLGIIFGGFCSKDIDVLVRYRNNKLGDGIWESGLNMFSLKTIRNYLAKYVDDIEALEFKIDIDLPESDDPARSYTVMVKQDERMILTGCNIVREFYVLKFIKR